MDQKPSLRCASNKVPWASRCLEGFSTSPNEEAVAQLGGATPCMEVSQAAHGARRSYYQSRASRTEALPVPQRTDIHSNLGTLVMYELHGCLSQGVSVCRLSDHPLAFDAGLMEHSRRGAVLLRVRMTARVAIRWGVHRLYEIAITAMTSWTLCCCSEELLRALKIIYGGECRPSRGVSVGKPEMIQSLSAWQSEVCLKSSCSKIEESRGCHACYR